MAQFEKTTRQLLLEVRFEASRQESQRLQQEFAKLRQGLNSVDTANDKLARESKQAAQSLDREAAAAREAASEYERLAREKSRSSTSGKNPALRTIEDIGDRGTAIAGAFGGAEGIGNALGFVGDAALAVTQLGVAGGGLIVATSAASLAFAELTRQIEEAKDKALEYINSQSELNELIAAGAASSDLRERRDQLQDTVTGLSATIADYTDIVERFDAANREAANNSALGAFDPANALEYQAVIEAFNAEISAATGGQITNIGALKDAITEQEKGIASAEAQIALYNQAIQSGATAQADARANAEALEQSLRDVATQTGQQTAAQEQSSDAIRNRRDAIQGELASLESSINTLRATATETNRYNEIADNLQRTVNQLTNELEQNNAAYRQALAREETEALAKEYTDLTAAIAKNKQTLSEIRDVSIKAYDDMLAAVAKIEADADDARSKALKKAADAQSEAYLDHLQALADIEKTAYRDTQRAVANRDAIAFVEAKRARQDALEKEGQSYDKRQRELEKSLDEQLQQIKENADKAIRAQQDQYTKEASLRVQQYQKILADQIQLQMRLNFVNQVGADNTISATNRYWTYAEKRALAALTVLENTSGYLAPDEGGFGAPAGARTRRGMTAGRVRGIVRDEMNVTFREALR